MNARMNSLPWYDGVEFAKSGQCVEIHKDGAAKCNMVSRLIENGDDAKTSGKLSMSIDANDLMTIATDKNGVEPWFLVTFQFGDDRSKLIILTIELKRNKWVIVDYSADRSSICGDDCRLNNWETDDNVLEVGYSGENDDCKAWIKLNGKTIRLPSGIADKIVVKRGAPLYCTVQSFRNVCELKCLSY
jgi:hypothetical protein